MCTKSSEQLILLIKGIDTDRIVHCYQSRFGPQAWLKPYTDRKIIQLAEQGAKRLLVACPGFAADCLETLHEIGHEAEKLFIDNGGEDLRLVPSLNASAKWVEAVRGIICESHLR